MILKWAYKELKNQKNYLVFFIINITIGFTSFFNLQLLKDSISHHFQERAQEGLGGDIALSVRRKWTIQEKSFIDQFIKANQLRFSHSYEFFAMAQLEKTFTKRKRSQNSNSNSNNNESINENKNSVPIKLVNVKTIDSNFPLYGQIDVKGNNNINLGEVLIDSSFKQNFSLQDQNKILLGDLRLSIIGEVINDSTQGFRISGLAPRVYINESNLENSKLISFGSTFSDIYLFRITDKNTNIQALELILKKYFSDPAIQITTADQSANERANALKYMTDFFSIIGMVSVFLAILVCYFLVKSYLQKNYLKMAILNSLGWKKKKIFYYYLLQIIFLTVSGFVSMGLFSLISYPIMEKILMDLSGLKIHSTAFFQTAVLLIFLSVLTIFIVMLPFFEKINSLSVQQIFQDSAFNTEIQKTINFKTLFYFISLFLGFVVLAVWQTHSLKLGVGFSFGLLAAALICLGAGWVWMFVFEKITSKMKWVLKYSILGVTRKKSISLISLICIACGVLVLHLTQSIQKNISTEIEAPKGLKLPKFFIFDVQEEQLELIKNNVQKNSGDINYLSPMVRGRILKINDTAFVKPNESENKPNDFKTRESEQEMRFRNRGVNLSYREQLSDSEKITKGHFWNRPFDSNENSVPEISIEESYANKMSFNINDILTFDIQGIEISGRITSFRKVKWNSFQPNFFILFQPGVLESAPKTYISAIQIPDSQISLFFENMIQTASNVSIIDVKDLSNKILLLTDQLLFALKLFALSVSLAGICIFIVIMSSYFNSQQKEYFLIHVLGAKSKKIEKYILYQISIIILASGILGLLLAEFFSFLISNFVFDGIYYFQIHQGFWILLGLTIIAILVAKSFYAFFDLRQ